MYPITKNYRELTTEEQKQQFYADMTVHQDKLPLIRFKDNSIVKTFTDLIIAFFYTRLPTFDVKENDYLPIVLKVPEDSNLVNGRNCQCNSMRRRSLIDFYLIQKYYLANPMNMERCANIYFNKLDRGLEDFIPRMMVMYKQYPQSYSSFKTEESTKQYHLNNYTLYYCTGVKRNVFNLSRNPADNFKLLKKNLWCYKFKIKSNEKV